jgi:NADP-dependent 3-hydroxy acid dehydrogenase YdfG
LNARFISEEEWNSTVKVNLTAVFKLTQAVLPGMIAKGEGTIITVSSLAALNPNLLGGAAYGAAKAGVKNFMTFLHNTYRNQGIGRRRSCPVRPTRRSWTIVLALRWKANAH